MRTTRSFLEQFLPSQRQRSFPAEFRIASPPWPVDSSKLLQRIADALEAGGSAAQPDKVSADDQMQLLADVGTGLWRARGKMTRQETNAPKDGLERAYRHVQSTLDILAAAGLQVKDHTGEPWIDGRAISAIAFQPTPGLRRETIIETIRPSIFFRGRHIQMAQVIVGTPTNEEQPSNSSTYDVEEVSGTLPH